MRNSSKLGKLFYLVFMGLAVLVSIAMGLLNNVLDFSPERYISNSINTVEVAYNGGDYEEFLGYEELDGVGYLDLYRSNRDLRIVLPPLYQSQESAYTFSSKLVRNDVIYY
jgi:putative ABC transport system permease protein